MWELRRVALHLAYPFNLEHSVTGIENAFHGIDTARRRPLKRPLISLPNEILDLILRSCSTVPDVHSLSSACKRFRDIFKYSAHLIVRDIILQYVDYHTFLYFIDAFIEDPGAKLTFAQMLVIGNEWHCASQLATLYWNVVNNKPNRHMWIDKQGYRPKLTYGENLLFCKAYVHIVQCVGDRDLTFTDYAAFFSKISSPDLMYIYDVAKAFENAIPRLAFEDLKGELYFMDKGPQWLLRSLIKRIHSKRSWSMPKFKCSGYESDFYIACELECRSRNFRVESPLNLANGLVLDSGRWIVRTVLSHAGNN